MTQNRQRPRHTRRAADARAAAPLHRRGVPRRAAPAARSRRSARRRTRRSPRSPTASAADVDDAVAARAAAFDEGPWPRLPRPSARPSCADRRARSASTPTTSSRSRCSTSACRSRRCAASPRARRRTSTTTPASITELHGRAFQVGDEFLNYTIHKPVGVAGLIMPWNAPLMLSTWRIAPALAAGNTVVLKPAEWSPLTATLLARGARGGGPAAGRLQRRARLRRDGRRAARRAPRRRPRSASPGSRRPGRRSWPTRRADAQALLGRARRQVAGGRVRGLPTSSSRSTRSSRRSSRSTAQRCTAGSRLLVEAPDLRGHRRRRSPRGRATSASATRSTRATELGPLITAGAPRARARVHRSRRATTGPAAWPAAAAARARRRELPRGDRVRRRHADDARLPGRRSSGLCSWRCRSTDEAEAIRLANATEYGLAAYVWTNDVAARAPRRARDRHGLVWINSQNVRDLRTPFGG